MGAVRSGLWDRGCLDRGFETGAVESGLSTRGRRNRSIVRGLWKHTDLKSLNGSRNGFDVDRNGALPNRCH